jgi:phosphatidylglycerol---prolipoprotein diacylglyceryl transferase
MNFSFPAWDPVLLDLPGPIDVRWYGLMYIVGFVIAHWILRRLCKRGFLALHPDQVGDLLVSLLFGVILGGRLGYALFYDRGLADPLRLLQIWNGGMSFHGGLIGVTVAFSYYAHRHKLQWSRLADACALCVTPGIALVRGANFINGELYGRVTEAGKFLALRFPTDPAATHAFGLELVADTRSKELAIQYAFRKRSWESIEGRLEPVDAYGRQIDLAALKERLDWSKVSEAVPYRYASQLMEGLAEGVLLGLLLWLLYRWTRRRPLAPGSYAGVFLVGYASARFLLEYLRQPDSQFTDPDDPLGTVLAGMTMGQTLSSAMLLLGLILIVRGMRRGRAALTDQTA